MRKLFILLLCTLSSAIVFGQNKNNGKVSVIIEKSVPQGDSLWVVDSSRGDAYYVMPNPKGQFILNLTGDFPRNARIGVDYLQKRWEITLNMEDGDALVVKTDLENNTQFSGKGSSSAEVLYFEKTLDAKMNAKLNRTATATETFKLFTDKGKDAIRNLEANKSKVSPVFYKKHLAELVNKNLMNELLVPTFRMNNYGLQLSESIPEGYWDLEKQVKMDDKLVDNKSYLDLMTNAYPTFLRNKELFKKGTLDDKIARDERIRIDYKLIENRYTGKVRSAVLAKTLEAAFQMAKNVEDYKPLMDEYIAKYGTPDLVKRVQTTYDNLDKTSNGKVPPHFVLKDQQGNDVTMKDFAGKVVYMDFWASWCGPCRAEMKNGSPKLHAKFKDNKDVVFLYVSIDDRADLWEKAIEDDKIEGVHVLSTGGFKSPVGRAFNIRGVPHYIIIGRDGKIFDNNAPRPSNDNTPAKINEALSKSF